MGLNESQLIDSAVAEVAIRAKKRNIAALQAAHNDNVLHAHANEIRKEFYHTNGFSKGRNMRWIGTVPAEVYNKACELYGEDAILKDKSLLKKAFDPWLVVKGNSI